MEQTRAGLHKKGVCALEHGVFGADKGGFALEKGVCALEQGVFG